MSPATIAGRYLAFCSGVPYFMITGPTMRMPMAEDARRVDRRALAREDVALGGAPAGAAIFRGPGRRRPAAPGQHLVPAHTGCNVGEHAAGLAAGLAQILAQIVVEEAADLARGRLRPAGLSARSMGFLRHSSQLRSVHRG